MKKQIWILLLAASALFAKEVTPKTFEALSVFQQKHMKVKEFQALDNLYLVKVSLMTRQGERMFTIAVSKDLKYTFLGRVVDNTNAQELYIKKSLSPYRASVNFTYGKGKNEYYLFIDPQCPYCKNFQRELSKRHIENRVKIHYILFPLSFHKDAVAMSHYILSQKSDSEKLQALNAIELGQSNAYKTMNLSQKAKTKLDAIIMQNMKVVQEVGVQGTPALFKLDGTKVDIGTFFKKYY